MPKYIAGMQRKPGGETYLFKPNYTSEQIASGTDLNTLTTPGHFYCANATAAANMTNGPVTNSGYTVHVEPQGVSGTHQLATINDGTVYSRVLPYNNGTWTSWRAL